MHIKRSTINNNINPLKQDQTVWFRLDHNMTLTCCIANKTEDESAQNKIFRLHSVSKCMKAVTACHI